MNLLIIFLVNQFIIWFIKCPKIVENLFPKAKDDICLVFTTQRYSAYCQMRKETKIKIKEFGLFSP